MSSWFVQVRACNVFLRQYRVFIQFLDNILSIFIDKCFLSTLGMNSSDIIWKNKRWHYCHTKASTQVLSLCVIVTILITCTGCDNFCLSLSGYLAQLASLKLIDFLNFVFVTNYLSFSITINCPHRWTGACLHLLCWAQYFMRKRAISDITFCNLLWLPKPYSCLVGWFVHQIAIQVFPTYVILLIPLCFLGRSIASY